MARRILKNLLLVFGGICSFAISGAAMAQIPDRRVHVWIKAYIAPPTGDSSLFTKTSGGKWGLRAPLSGAPLLPKGCFGIDERSFSLDPEASARVTFEANLLIKARDMQVLNEANRNQVRIGSTTNFDCQTGTQLQEAKSASTTTVTVGSVKKSPDGKLLTFNVRASSSNPFYNFGIPLAPRIDFEAVFQFNVITQKLKIFGTTGVFPSFEMYYAVNRGAPIAIFKRAPAAGVGPGSLADFGTGINTLNFEQEIGLPIR